MNQIRKSVTVSASNKAAEEHLDFEIERLRTSAKENSHPDTGDQEEVVKIANRAILVRYVITLVVLTILIGGGIAASFYVISKNEQSAGIINLAGKQRSLSQRIISEVLLHDYLTPQQQEENITSLENDIAAMTAAHESLIFYANNFGVTDTGRQEILDHLFHEDSNLDYFVKRFISSTNVAMIDFDEPSQRYLISQRNSILHQLDHAVTLFERFARHQIQFIEYMLLVFAIISFATLAGLYTFIFLPMQWRVTELVRRIEHERSEASQFLAVARQLAVFPFQNPNIAFRANWDGQVAFANSAADQKLRLLKSPGIREIPHSLWETISSALETDETIETEIISEDGIFLATIVPSIKDRYANVYAREITREKQAEARARKTQKFELIGQLTGGFAHEFNNILGIVLGNLQLLKRKTGDDEKSNRMAQTAIDAVGRASTLTGQLLAFSQRQALKSEKADVNDLLRGMQGLIERTTGPEIDFDMTLSSKPLNTEVDAAELETAIFNIINNSSEAMPNGGKLRIDTQSFVVDSTYASGNESVELGRYVMISVTDNGVGINHKDIDQVFEPFFTTKDIGDGSGLGLSMVYGFVQQSGGHVSIYSEPELGTTIRLFLPLIDAVPEDAYELPQPSQLPRGSETILIVEDVEELRLTNKGLLEDLGYTVFEATDAGDAMSILPHRIDIDLLFTDLVMPGDLDGRDLAEYVQRTYPNIRILLTSGFPEDDDEATKFHTLMKPHPYTELATKVRYVLDEVIPKKIDGELE